MLFCSFAVALGFLEASWLIAINIDPLYVGMCSYVWT